MSGKYSILKFLVDERVHDYQANVKYHHLTRRNDEGQGKKGTSDGINIE